LRCEWSRSPSYMQHDVLLPCSQGLLTDPYTQLNESSAYYHIVFREMCSNIILSLIVPNGVFPYIFSIRRLCDFLISHIRAACTALLILLDFNALIISRYLLCSFLGPRHPIQNL
jgi:hypothetical protein